MFLTWSRLKTLNLFLGVCRVLEMELTGCLRSSIFFFSLSFHFSQVIKLSRGCLILEVLINSAFESHFYSTKMTVSNVKCQIFNVVFKLHFAPTQRSEWMRKRLNFRDSENVSFWRQLSKLTHVDSIECESPTETEQRTIERTKRFQNKVEIRRIDTKRAHKIIFYF